MIDFNERPQCNVSLLIDDVVKNNGGRISVCNKLGITTVALQAYRQGKLKMTGKVKDKFFDIYGVKFDEYRKN